MVTFALRHGKILTMGDRRRIIDDGCVIINDDTISDVGPDKLLASEAESADEVIDAKNFVIMPGLVNTHVHLWQTLGKGLGPDRQLWNWIRDAWTPLIEHLKPEDFYYASLMGLLEGILSGTTCFLGYEHAVGAYPKAVPHIARGFKDACVRGILGVGYQDTGQDAFAPDFIIQSRQTIDHYFTDALKRFHKTLNGRLHVWGAPGTVNWVSPELFHETLQIIEEYDSGITVHCDESPSDIEYSKKVYGAPQTERLYREGVTGPRLLTVHLNYVSDTGIRIHGETHTGFSHNPVSNPYLAGGVAPVKKILDADVTMGLATDGALSNNNLDMFDVIRIAPLVQKAYFNDPLAMTAQQTLEAATINGARAMRLGDKIGTIEKGKKADIIMVDLAKPNVTPLASIPAALVYSASSENVDTVIVDGKILLRNRRFQHIDPTPIMEKATKIFERIQEEAAIAF
ncbi:MAG: amidohydrolase family protein [Candidatus Ranarchaeia archaeon]